MTKDVTVSARIAEETNDKIERLAHLTGRSKSWHITQALEQYLRAEMQFIEAVQGGLDDLEQGKTVSHETVLEMMKRYQQS